MLLKGFSGGSDSKESACNAGDQGSISGLGRSTAEGNDNPLQYSCLGNSMDRGGWWATVHGVTKTDLVNSFWLLYSILKFTYTLLNLIINDHWLLFLIFYFYKYCYKECLGTYSVWLCRHHEAAISDGRDEIWPL